MSNLLMILAGVLGFTAVALGAFGAHALRNRLAPLPDGAQRQAWWKTGADYHLAHAAAVGVSAAWSSSAPSNWVLGAGVCFAAGVVLFSGSLYVMTLTGKRALGAITPLGGLLMLLGWAALTVAAAVRMTVP